MYNVHHNIIAWNLPLCHTFREPGNYIYYSMIIYVETGIREIYVSKPWGAFTNPLGVKIK